MMPLTSRSICARLATVWDNAQPYGLGGPTAILMRSTTDREVLARYPNNLNV